MLRLTDHAAADADDNDDAAAGNDAAAASQAPAVSTIDLPLSSAHSVHLLS